MRVVGIVVRAQNPKRPVALLVLGNDESGTVQIENQVDLPSDEDDLPVLLHDCSEALRSQLKILAPDRVVIRRADHSHHARQTDGPKYRLLMEGALTSAARSVIPDTRIGTGKETGEWYGAAKAALDGEAEKLSQAQALAGKYKEAVSAALAGLALGP